MEHTQFCIDGPTDEGFYVLSGLCDCVKSPILKLSARTRKDAEREVDSFIARSKGKNESRGFIASVSRP